MFETLNRPLLVLALILIVIALGLDLGSSLLPISNSPGAIDTVVERTRPTLKKLDLSQQKDVIDKLRAGAGAGEKPPGWGIPAMALVDGIVVYGLVMLVLPIFISQEFHGRISGLVTLIFSILLLIGAIALVITALIKTFIMVSLLMATPFGTIAYMIIWGFFNRAGATAILSLSMLVKLVFAICLILAHPRFLQSKGLVLMVLTSIVTVLIISFLHGLVPIVLVSITDMVAAIIIGIIAAVWGIVLLVGGIMGLVRAVV